MIPGPYHLYLGSSTDPISVKTSRGIAVWRPELAVGEFRRPGCTITLGLDHLDFAEAAAKGAKTMVLGVANAGGIMARGSIDDVLAALAAGLNVASGLHQRLRSVPEIVAAAEAAGLDLFDVRDAPPNLPVGNGRPRGGNRLLTVGTDCSVGKMYTTLAIEKELHRRGVPATFRATGQTGILIAGSGVPIDAVVADFISGGAEWISPSRNDGGWDLIEGQGSLFHPSYAGVSLGLLHGSQPDLLVLCHEHGRPHMRGLPDQRMPGLEEVLEVNLSMARLTSPRVSAIGVALNTSALDADAARAACAEIEDQLGLPCQDPIAMGVERIVDGMLTWADASVAA